MYEELLKSKGLKITPQRLMALKIIATGGHIDVDHLNDALKEHGMKMPLATVYRILGELSACGILHTVTITGQKTLYEIAKGDHPHFLCQECGHLEDLQMAMKKIVNIAQNACTHSTHTVSVMLHGICQACDSKNSVKH
jgi:Fur family peroxide stress response transcriptional regulator